MTNLILCYNGNTPKIKSLDKEQWWFYSVLVPLQPMFITISL